MRKLRVPIAAKRAARQALEKRASQPPSRRAGLDPQEARKQGIDSGVSRARQLVRQEYIGPETAKKVARFYDRFKNKTGERAEQAIDLWGGRRFGQQAKKFVRGK